MSGRTGLARLVLLGALSAFGPLSLDMYLPAFPALARDLPASASAVQLTLTACLVGLAAGQLGAGPLSDRFGRRRPLLVGVASYAGVSLLCAIAPGPWSLTGLRLVQGAAGSAGIVICRAVVRDLHEGRAAARYFSLLLVVNGLAPVLAPLLGAQLLRVTSWRGVFVALAVIGVVLLAGVGALLPETLPPQSRRDGGGRAVLQAMRELLGDRVFVGYAVTSGCVLGAMFGYIAGASFVLQQVYGLTPQQFSFVFAGNAVGIVVAGRVSARLVTRVGPRPLLTAGVAVSATGAAGVLLAVLLGAPLGWLLAALLLVVASVGLVHPNATALAMADHPHQAGTASALLGLAQYAVGGAVAPLVGLGGTRTAVPTAVVIAGCAAAATVVRAVQPAH